jgi:hypothetical protein
MSYHPVMQDPIAVALPFRADDIPEPTPHGPRRTQDAEPRAVGSHSAINR